MYTQVTPAHARLWHRGFIKLLLAHFFLTSAVYMSMSLLSSGLTSPDGYRLFACLMGCYAVGILLPAPFNNFLIQRFRRNGVCLFSMLLFTAGILGFYLTVRLPMATSSDATWLMVLRGFSGMTSGLAQMVLCGTLIIDVCESHNRSRANLLTAWCGRLGMAAGTAAGLLYPLQGAANPWLVVVGLSLAAFLPVATIHFPFRVPDEVHRVVSLDRFFLVQGRRLFVTALLMSMGVGLLLAATFSAFYVLFFLLGIALSMFASNRWPEQKDNRLSLAVAFLTALLAVFLARGGTALFALSAVLLGRSWNLAGSLLLSLLFRSGDHCQRATAQNTYFLASEWGVSIGLLAGCLLMVSPCIETALVSAAFLFVSSLLLSFFGQPRRM